MVKGKTKKGMTVLPPLPDDTYHHMTKGKGMQKAKEKRKD